MCAVELSKGTIKVEGKRADWTGRDMNMLVENTKRTASSWTRFNEDIPRSTDSIERNDKRIPTISNTGYSVTVHSVTVCHTRVTSTVHTSISGYSL